MATYTYNIGDSLRVSSQFTYVDNPAPPAGLPISLAPTIIIFGFPMDDPCCKCPQGVACVKCSRNGKMYVPSKGNLTKGV